jgi:hypothetical protein
MLPCPTDTSADGSLLVTKTQDGCIRGWSLDVQDLVQEAQGKLGRNLRQIEWEQYFPGEPYRPTFSDLTLPEEGAEVNGLR